MSKKKEEQKLMRYIKSDWNTHVENTSNTMTRGQPNDLTDTKKARFKK